MKTIPERFSERMQTFIGDQEWKLLEQSIHDEPPVSIRKHATKNTTIETKEQVPWCPEGYYLQNRPSFTLDPEFHAGAYYVQEASSMSLWQVLDSIGSEYNDPIILDLCGAPGGKSSLIASWLNHQGLLVTNEVIRNRAYILKQNMVKDAYPNVIVSNNDPSDFSQLVEFFDIILVDAPCSGEGMFRKDMNARSEWSEENVFHCSVRQKRILGDICNSLKPGGKLIYSTCTYNESENIENVVWLCQNPDFESVSIPFDRNHGIINVGKHNCYGYQFYPHKIKGEGFFISVVHKKGNTGKNNSFKLTKPLEKLSTQEGIILKDWISENHPIIFKKDKTGRIHGMPVIHEKTADILNSQLRLIHCGIDIGIINKTVFLPDHGLALSGLLSEKVKSCELNKEDALKFLKKDLLSIDNNVKKGWVLIKYNGLGLGWIKNLGNRINNYLPNEWRIRMELPITN